MFAYHLSSLPRMTTSTTSSSPRQFPRWMPPWLAYFLVFALTTAVGIVTIRYFFADDMMAAVFAAGTFGFIVAACLGFWISLSRGNEVVMKPRRVKKQTVRVTAHICTKDDLKKSEDTASNTSSCPSILCPICLVEFEEGTEVARLECDHLYHLECISEWVIRKAQCPACRFALPTVTARDTPEPVQTV
jgi:hypothetical protein